MVGEAQAAAEIGESLGYAVGLFLLPALGVVLLFVGVWLYRAAHRRPPPSWQPGYPPGHPAPGPLPARPRTGRPIAMIVIGGVLLALGLGGAGLAALGASGEPTAGDILEVGQCITDGQYSSAEMSPSPTDCSERGAVYELAYRGEGPAATCPDGAPEDSAYAVLFNDSHTLCFVLNVEEGECFSVDPDAQLFTPVDCADPTATARVDAIIDGEADLSLCPEGPWGAAFPEPARTFCVVQP